VPAQHHNIKNVLHMIETSGPGGAENMLINNVLTLKQLGIGSDVLLIKDGWLRQKLLSLNINCHLVPLDRFLSPKWLARVKSIVIEGRYDAIHGHEFAMNCHGALLSLLCGIPAVATVHGKNYYSDRFYRRILYRSAAKIAHFVAVSEDIKQFLVQRVGVKASRLSVIANGIDIKKHQAHDANRSAIRTELGISEGEILIGAVGNLYPVKGHIYLVQAAAKVLAEIPSARFVIAGRGEEQQRLQAEIDRLAISTQFQLLGLRDDVDRLLQGFDIFVMPSLSEGMPLSILEAMAAKRIVVASAVGGIPEFIEDGRNGLLVPSQEPDQLANVLLMLIRNADIRSKIAEAAHAEVCDRFSQDTCTAEYLKLYHQK